MAVPRVKEAEPLFGISHIDPSGRRGTRTPLRPRAITVGVAVCAGGGGETGGLMVSDVVFGTPAARR